MDFQSLPVMRLTPQQFLSLAEYSCSMPTGTTPGKKWRRLDGAYDPASRLPKDDPGYIQPRWVICEYSERFEYPDDHHAVRGLPPGHQDRPGYVKVILYRPVISVPSGARAP